jgi:L-ascorbate metabolism protein UlaG (beta-lactamase superfamily)
LAGHWLESHEEKVSLKWIRHSGFKISTSSVVIYIDPYQVPDAPHDATFVLCSHTHNDHFSTGDIAKVAGTQMQLIGPPDVVASYGKGLSLAPGQVLQLGSVTIQGVRAYNTNKSNHPKASNWLGFVVEIGGKRLYHAGDTDLIEEMKSLEDIDVAMLPVSGTYAMTAAEAAVATTTYFHPRLAIPMHWGTIVGSLADAQSFSQKAGCPVKVMTAGETISLE